MSRFIKMQEEQYPLSSPEYDHTFFNNCITTFYDQDSDHQIIQAKCSAHQVLFYLESTIDICDTPLQKIMQIVSFNTSFKGVDLDLVKRKILKQKNILKRNRAKGRVLIPKPKPVSYNLPAVISDQEEEFKKQRNRISAQISRDRKKQKVKELEELNRQLQQQCNMTKIENQKLREEVEANKNKKNEHLGQQFKNKVTKMLIILGVIFLFGLIKDIFNHNQSSNSPLTKITQSESNFLSLKNEPFFLASSQKERIKIIESIEEPLNSVIEDKTIIDKIQERISRGLADWNEQSWLYPSAIRENLDKLKNIAFK